jgi:FixJ family two-component response regulator
MKRVLLVEDDEAVRRAVTQLLTRAGWDVRSFPDVDEAIRGYGVRPCDVVLSDLVMPGRDALDLLAALRAHDPRLAFVVMSGYLTDERFREVLQAGASDCLAKPCEQEDMVRALSRAIVLRSSSAQPMTAAGEHAMVLSVPAELGQLAAVLQQVDLTAQAGGFDLRRNRILLALDEAFTNAVVHGARADARQLVEVRASFSQHGGVVSVSDPGPGFDPVLAEAVQDEAHRHRGLHLLRIACDDVRWIGRGNVCQMVFRQPPVEECRAARSGDTTVALAKLRRRAGASSGKLAVARRISDRA